MHQYTNIIRRTLAALIASSVTLAPAANATVPENHREPSASDATAQQDGNTHIEYRSEEDRLAFEKLGKFIHTSDNGTVTETIPGSVRRSHRDASKRIEEFVNVANMAQAEGKNIPVTTYGNENKVDGWGPIQKVYISHDTLNKILKIIGAGGGAAAVTEKIAAELVIAGLSGPAGWVAVGLAALFGAGVLCDWNDQGIIIWKIPGAPLPGCIPQK